MNHSITPELQMAFAEHLRLEEKSSATIDKYSRDVRTFVEFVCGREIDKALVLEYKKRTIGSVHRDQR
jgi:hypothetical protein